MGTKNRFCKLFWISVLLLLEYIVDILSDRFLFFREIEAKIDVFAIPKHSPELNMCDYWLWKHVNAKMREQERNWPKGKKEDRDGYLRRLKRTAMSLTKEEIDDAQGNMKRRCMDLKASKGGPIEG